MGEERRIMRHRLSIDNRETVSITGVTDVISFDEESVVCDTDMGVIVLKGNNLTVSNLNLDNGLLDIFGEVSGIVYEDELKRGNGKPRSSMFGRIFK